MDDIGRRQLICTWDENWFEVEDIIINSVSKLWRRLICSPNFIHLQLSRSKQNPSYIVLPSYVRRSNAEFVKIDGETVEMITLSGHEYLYNCQMICSSNGFICWIGCHGTYLDIFICNLATRDVLLLRKSRPHDEDPSFGVGFGPGINEYKVFWFFMQYAHCSTESIWIKKCSVKMPVSENGHVSSVAARNNEILFIVLNRYLVYNVRNGSWKEIWRRDDVAGCVPPAFAFTESLLPCTGFIGS
ncbi:hypothetical protein PVL29_025603 [Vitis rotundifolia]|uniref:F-box protein n=1 Tax=Vitis rotundifolia TaxID=103349 RepID=A0AA38YKA4_VITRO|nr:hypothetical protein PVL29_025603 [Vitis rotundifolia]